jgi:GNAT superfamily N-acetyltransferase
VNIINDLIREFQPADEAEVVEAWYRSGIATYTFLPTGRSLPLSKGLQSRHPTKLLDLGSALDERVVAYLAMKGTCIDRLYVDPLEWRKGWGTRLVNFAKQVSPRGLELYTHQENSAARAFYERHGFRPVKFGLSPPPESAPDVEYHGRHTLSAPP